MAGKAKQRRVTRCWRPALVITVSPLILLSAACTEIQRPTPEPFYAESTPPAKQEFRWSNGKMPKSFDPARASAAPETDVVRALFEGLTETDARTLQAVPAAAEKWSSSDDLRTWIFHLRKDARWSNSEPVTAFDFVSSWKRLALLGDKAAHPELFQNIIGLGTPKPASAVAPRGPIDFLPPTSATMGQQVRTTQANTASPPTTETMPNPNGTVKNTDEKGKAAAKPTPTKFGVEALDDLTLKVSLERPDKDLPKLVANPIFRPIYGDGVELETDPLDTGVVTNGAFSVQNVDKDGVALKRSETYWDASAVSLDSVRFVPWENAESALDAYRKGEIDAVTNAEFEPLVLKLLAPYDDFRQTTHSALNFYEFNIANPPFNDRRVREALAVSIDRDRLTVGELEGSAQSATSFLPLGEKNNAKFVLDVDRAKELLEKAGFPKGEGFPRIRLLINRNDTQQRVARLIARMWKQNLNIDTEIDVKDPAELENARSSGQYDLVRRGIVLPTGDETVSLAAIFSDPKMIEVQTTAVPKEVEKTVPPRIEPPAQGPHASETTELLSVDASASHPGTANGVVTEEAAVYEIQAIPLYFPMSYSLVKPYVEGFETNSLDAPILKDISIDNDWRPRINGQEP
jgi:oligopeptide transport system substrate-binding protein